MDAANRSPKRGSFNMIDSIESPGRGDGDFSLKGSVCVVLVESGEKRRGDCAGGVGQRVREETGGDGRISLCKSGAG